MSFVTFALATIAFGSLALSMTKHIEQIAGQELSATWRMSLRAIGFALLVFSAVLCVRHFDVGIGLAYWCGILTACGILCTLTLTYRPALFLRLIAVCSLAVLAAVVFFS